MPSFSMRKLFSERTVVMLLFISTFLLFVFAQEDIKRMRNLSEPPATIFSGKKPVENDTPIADKEAIEQSAATKTLLR